MHCVYMMFHGTQMSDIASCHVHNYGYCLGATFYTAELNVVHDCARKYSIDQSCSTLHSWLGYGLLGLIPRQENAPRCTGDALPQQLSQIVGPFCVHIKMIAFL